MMTKREARTLLIDAENYLRSYPDDPDLPVNAGIGEVTLGEIAEACVVLGVEAKITTQRIKSPLMRLTEGVFDDEPK